MANEMKDQVEWVYDPATFVGLVNCGPMKGELACLRSPYFDFRPGLTRNSLRTEERLEPGPWDLRRGDRYHAERFWYSLHAEAPLLQKSRFVQYGLCDVGKAYRGEVRIGTIALMLTGIAWNTGSAPLDGLDHWCHLSKIIVECDPRLRGFEVPYDLVDDKVKRLVQPISEWEELVVSIPLLALRYGSHYG